MRLVSVFVALAFAAPVWAQTTDSSERPKGTLAFDLLVPASSDFGAGDPAYGCSLGFWSDISFAAIQSRLSFQLAPGDRGAYVLNLGADAGGSWVPLQGLVTPLLGAGIGARWLRVRSETRVRRDGEVITRVVKTWQQDSHFGFSWYARAGALFFRDAPVRLLLTADYTMAIFGDGLRPQAVVFSLGMVF
jgi:hypothetical protein